MLTFLSPEALWLLLAGPLLVAAYVLLMRRRLNGINGAEILRGLGSAAVATLGMGLALVAWLQVTGGMNPWLVGLGGIAIGGMVYALGAVLLKVPEIQGVMVFVKRRIGR